MNRCSGAALVAGAIQEFDHIASRNARQQPPAPARQNDLLDASAVFVRGSGAHFCNVAAQGIDRDAFDRLRDLNSGRAHVWTPDTNAQIVCRLLLEKKQIMINEYEVSL